MENTEHIGFKPPRMEDYSPASFKGDTIERRDLVKDRFPRGKVVLLVGAGDVGKSFLILQAFEAINGGACTEAFGGQIVSRELPCICIMGEDDRSSVDLRLKSIRSQFNVKPVTHGAIFTAPDIGYMGLVQKDYSGAVQPTDVLEWLELQLAALKAETGELGFLAIDTFSMLLPVDANRPDEVQKALSLLTSIAARYDICVIVTHHMRKEEKDTGSSPDALRSAIRGSTALVDGVRAAYVMHKLKPNDAARIRKELDLEHEGEVVELLLVKNNLGLRRDPITFVRMPNGVLSDVSRLLGKRLTPEEAMLQVLRDAKQAGRKITKTGPSGLYASRAPSWPGGLGEMPKAKIEGLANQLIENGKLRANENGLVVLD